MAKTSFKSSDGIIDHCDQGIAALSSIPKVLVIRSKEGVNQWQVFSQRYLRKSHLQKA